MKQFSWKKIYLILLGFIALCWFLIRVIPKPSRAGYPCQQAAFPIASAFVIWLISLGSSALLYIKFKKSLHENKLVYATLFIILFGLVFLFYSTFIPTSYLFAGKPKITNKAYWSGTDRMMNLKTNNISSFDEVAIVKSNQTNASDIEFEEIESMVREAVLLAGGINGIISNGDYVVLKPNLVEMPPTPTPEYVEVSGMATDWRVVKAVAKIVRELNPDGKIYIIESSSASSTRDILDYYNYTLESIPEVDQIIALEDSCGAFEDYTDVNLEQIYLEDSIRLYPDEAKPNLSPEFYINKIYYDADVVICIPVLKNHKVAIITEGVKNVAIGMAPPNIYGMSETFFGKWTKIDHSIENLNKWLHDFYLCRPVDFVVVDGLQGFDHGPTGIPELTMEEMQHNMRLILAGNNALSVDAVCGLAMSLDPTFADYMVYLDKEEYGVGTINSKFIRVLGEDIEIVREVFMHETSVAIDAIYSDYEGPEIQIDSIYMEGNTISFEIQFDEDLNKIELEVNGVLLDEICVDNFGEVSFEVIEDLLPFETAILFAYDRFFNLTQFSFENLAINEQKLSFVRLEQNFPNPFSNTTTINFYLQNPVHAKVYISDIHGRIVEILRNKEYQSGDHQIKLMSDLPDGIYILTLDVEGRKINKKMIKK